MNILSINLGHIFLLFAEKNMFYIQSRMMWDEFKPQNIDLKFWQERLSAKLLSPEKGKNCTSYFLKNQIEWLDCIHWLQLKPKNGKQLKIKSVIDNTTLIFLSTLTSPFKHQYAMAGF